MTHFWEEIWNFGKFDLWWPLVTWILTWPQNDLCKYCRAWKELSNTFFAFSLGHIVSEISRGRVPATPPAVRSWPRPPSVRGLRSLHPPEAMNQLTFEICMLINPMLDYIPEPEIVKVKIRWASFTYQRHHKNGHLLASLITASVSESCDWWQLIQRLERHLSLNPCPGRGGRGRHPQ